MARSSPRVVDRRLQPGEVWASKAGTGLGASVGTHFSLLWVLAGFVVLTVIICTYAGEQRHLAERHFGDVVVHGKLSENGIRTKVYRTTLTGPFTQQTGAGRVFRTVANGFSVGHFITRVGARVDTATGADFGPLTAGTGAAGLAVDSNAATDAAGAVMITATNATGSNVTTASGNNLGIVAARPSIYVLAGAVGAAGPAGSIEVFVEVSALDGAPDLP